MLKRSSALAALLAALFLIPAAPAWADHDGGYGGWREGCGEQGGGCGNEREEDYGDGSCKYFCPAFDRSPVEDSFNPTICVMPGSCSGDERRRGGQDEPPPAEPVAAMAAGPASLFPPTPGAVRDFVLATIKAGLELGQLFADATISFVSNLLIGMA